MVGGPVVGVLLGIVGVIFVLLGYFALGVCGNGTSLIYFGIGVALFGGGLALSGQIPVATILFLMFVGLVIAGILLTNAAGCAI
jgi:hypothetical protein